MKKVNYDIQPNKLSLIEGSTGNRYFVRKINGKYECTCKGYKYYKNCYHIKNFKKKIEDEETGKQQ
jgi:hypothetical protein